jgi:hypothetical protein
MAVEAMLMVRIFVRRARNPAVRAVPIAFLMVIALPPAGGLAPTVLAVGPTTVTFTYTGGPQTFTVPAGVTSITVDAFGAQGEDDIVGNPPSGEGGEATATLSVTPGQVLQVNVGGTGGFVEGGSLGFPGFGGGGAGVSCCDDQGTAAGGGASDVRTGPNYTLSDRLLVAGGGGGGGLSFLFPTDDGHVRLRVGGQNARG